MSCISWPVISSGAVAHHLNETGFPVSFPFWFLHFYFTLYRLITYSLILIHAVTEIIPFQNIYSETKIRTLRKSYNTYPLCPEI